MLSTALPSVQTVKPLPVEVGTERFGYGIQTTEISKERSLDTLMVSHSLRLVPMGRPLRVRVETKRFGYGIQTMEISKERS